jgi:hypothetical protein
MFMLINELLVNSEIDEKIKTWIFASSLLFYEDE